MLKTTVMILLNDLYHSFYVKQKWPINFSIGHLVIVLIKIILLQIGEFVVYRLRGSNTYLDLGLLNQFGDLS